MGETYFYILGFSNKKNSNFCNPEFSSIKVQENKLIIQMIKDMKNHEEITYFLNLIINHSEMGCKLYS